jgi:uncharacterized membrane protein
MHFDLLFLLAALLLNAAGLLLFPSSPLLLPLGAISLFFIPGYLLLTTLYLDRRSLPPAQRFLSAFGLSVVVSSLLLLLVAYTAGFTIRSAFIALLAWALPLSLLTALRRRSIYSPRPTFLHSLFFRSTRFTSTHFAIRNSQSAAPLPPGDVLRRRSPLSVTTLSAAAPLLLISLILLFSLARLIASASAFTPQFTEFYILGPGGLLGDLPERVQPGAAPEIFVGIANHEGRPVDYQVQIQISGLPAPKRRSPSPLTTLTLQDGACWEEKIALPRLPGPDRRKITLTLHKDADPAPYRTVYLWLSGAYPNTAMAQPAAFTFLNKKPATLDPAIPTPDANPVPAWPAAGLPTWLANAAMAVLVALLATKELANASEDPRHHRLSRCLNLPILPLFMLFALIIFTRLAAALR